METVAACFWMAGVAEELGLAPEDENELWVEMAHVLFREFVDLWGDEQPSFSLHTLGATALFVSCYANCAKPASLERFCVDGVQAREVLSALKVVLAALSPHRVVSAAELPQGPFQTSKVFMRSDNQAVELMEGKEGGHEWCVRKRVNVLAPESMVESMFFTSLDAEDTAVRTAVVAPFAWRVESVADHAMTLNMWFKAHVRARKELANESAGARSRAATPARSRFGRGSGSGALARVCAPRC